MPEPTAAVSRTAFNQLAAQLLLPGQPILGHFEKLELQHLLLLLSGFELLPGSGLLLPLPGGVLLPGSGFLLPLPGGVLLPRGGGGAAASWRPAASSRPPS